MLNEKEKILSQARAVQSDVVAIRRHLHQNPELSFEETETSAFLQDQLKRLDIPFKAGFVKNGILGWIDGRKPGGRIIALRADMDALPVNEINDIPFKSCQTGKMHACGHDLHMAALVGTARILHSMRDTFGGRILLLFQPAEEKLPGGAKMMIEEGVFNGNMPAAIIGQHVMPRLTAGKVGYRPGMYMASSDEIYITVRGKGGHAAMPHQLIDPVLIAAHVIVSLQQVVSRKADPAIPSVLSFGKVDAPGATNVIPSEVKLEGTFRTMNESWRDEAHQLIRTIAGHTAVAMGGSCEVNIMRGYPVLFNNEELTHRAAALSAELLGGENVSELDLRMTAEDFAYYSAIAPTLFYRFGTTDAGGNYISPLHSPTFMADEQALETAMANMAWLALNFVKE
jgi:amidohydrolase